MHRAVQIISAAVALGFVAFIGWWGYGSSDNPQAAVMTAALCSTVAALGFFGPWYGVHTWPTSRTWGAAIFLAGVIALLFNLSNSFTAMATRNDATQAERSKVVASREAATRALADVERQAVAIAITSPTTAAAVKVVQIQTTYARQRREAECSSKRGGRGSRCRQREADEAAVLAALAKAEQDRAATERHEALQARADALRSQLATAPPVHAPAPTVATYARLFHIPDAQALTLSEWLKLGLAAAVELGLAIMIAGGERGRVVKSPRTNDLAILPDPPATADDYVFAKRLKVEIGATSTFRGVYSDYRTWAHSEGRPALAPDDFGARMADLCEGTDVTLRPDTGLFVNVRVAGATKLPVKRLGQMTTVGTA